MEKLQTNLVLEIMGRPKENVETSMKGLVERMSKEKGVNIINPLFHEAVPVEKTDLFTTFSELLVEFDTIEDLLQAVFKYMPSNLEIIKPEKLLLTNHDFNALTNRLAQKLHQYDAIVKNTLLQRDMLAKKLKEVSPELFKKEDNKIVLNEKDSNKKEIKIIEKKENEEKSEKRKSKKNKRKTKA